MQVLIAIVAGLVGLAAGSFANVPIHRWPRQGSVLEPRRSACPSCGEPVRAHDNLPVLSWLVLRGRCRDCGATIAVRYLLVEAVTAALFVRVAWVWWEQPLLFLTLLTFTWALVVATAIDLEHRIIPNRLTYRLPVVLAVLLVADAAVEGTWLDLRRAGIAAIVVPGSMFLLSEAFRILRGKVGLGMGDVKLALSLGLVVGYLGGIPLVVFAYGSVITATVVAVTLILLGRAKLASRIPFGPYLAVGALLPVLAPQGTDTVVRNLLGL